MYSPKIKDDLIPLLYQLGKKEDKAMTEIVDEILREYLTKSRMIAKEAVVYEAQKETIIIRDKMEERRKW